MFSFFIWQSIDKCHKEDTADDFAFVEIYLSPNTNLKYTMKFCFPGENYGIGEKTSVRGENQFWSLYGSGQNKVLSKSSSSSSSSSFIENETINKGTNVPFNSFEKTSEEKYSKHGNPLELFSSGTHVYVRFYSSDGRFPSKGFRAKFKTGNARFLDKMLHIFLKFEKYNITYLSFQHLTLQKMCSLSI